MPEVLYDRQGPIAHVTLNRPKQLNALTRQASIELLSALREADAPDVRVVVLTGAGRAFCSGSDLNVNFGADSVPPEETLRTWRHPVLLALRALPKPIISAVNGVAAGIGVGVALAGDLVVARDDATFLLAFTRVGLVPDGGTSWFVARAIGRPRAVQLALLGEPLAASDARDMGLISDCIPAEQFDDHVATLADRLAQGPTRAYGLMKRAFDAAGALPDHLELEAQLQAQAARTRDFQEGRSAFLAKRDPVFRGD
jgi:2-(1,2-epoxy-1,2-dihydrophenyl)acetyl-CoA isomerase